MNRLPAEDDEKVDEHIHVIQAILSLKQIPVGSSSAYFAHSKLGGPRITFVLLRTGDTTYDIACSPEPGVNFLIDGAVGVSEQLLSNMAALCFLARIKDGMGIQDDDLQAFRCPGNTDDEHMRIKFATMLVALTHSQVTVTREQVGDVIN